MPRTLKTPCGKKGKNACNRAKKSCVYTKKNGSRYCKVRQSKLKKSSNPISVKSKRKRPNKSSNNKTGKRKYKRLNRVNPFIYDNDVLNFKTDEYMTEYSDRLPEKQELVIDFDKITQNSSDELARNELDQSLYYQHQDQEEIVDFKNRTEPFPIENIEDLSPESNNIVMEFENPSNIITEIEIPDNGVSVVRV